MANLGQNAFSGASTGAGIGTAIMPGIGTAIGAGVGALGGLALGAIQNRQSKKQMEEDEKNRPAYEIPSEIKNMLPMAQLQALEGLPEEQKRQYLANLSQGAAYSLSQQQTRKGGLAGIPQINQQLQQGYSNLLSQDAAARMQRQGRVYDVMQNVGNYKDQQFQLNKLNPYYEGISRRNAQQGALYQNINSALNMAPLLGSAIGGMGQQGQSGAMANPGFGQPQYAANIVSPQQSVTGANVPGMNNTALPPLPYQSFNYSSF